MIVLCDLVSLQDLSGSSVEIDDDSDEVDAAVSSTMYGGRAPRSRAKQPAIGSVSGLRGGKVPKRSEVLEDDDDEDF